MEIYMDGVAMKVAKWELSQKQVANINQFLLKTP